MATRRRIEVDIFLGWACVSGACLIGLFWVGYFGGVSSLADDPSTASFESAFPVADTLLVALLAGAGWCVLRRHRLGPRLLCAAGAATLYLGLLDLTFYLGHDSYAPPAPEFGANLALHLACLVGGTVALVVGCRLPTSGRSEPGGLPHHTGRRARHARGSAS